MAFFQAKNLAKTFGELKAVDDVSFEINKGDIFALLGPNGAGKTTIINMITLSIPRNAGTIMINGASVDSDRTMLSKIGVCTQELQLWPLLTCIEQLNLVGKMYGLKNQIIKERANHLLEVIGLKEKKKALASTLSGGMKRRLHLILSLIHDPEMLILDEPEAGLDPQSRILVREYIQSLANNKTILLTTHNMDEAERLATRVAIMDHGNILEADTAEKLRAKMAPEESLEFIYDRNVQLSQPFKIDPYRVICKDDKIVVQGKQVIDHLPEILGKVIASNGDPATFNFRRSSLEDVFIKLTGRSLRE